MAVTARASVRELLTELAHLEDAARQVRATGGAAGPAAPPGPQLAALLARQDRIIAALRATRE